MTAALEFVVFSDDWGEHPSSCQHLFRRIARKHRTVWVNTLGLRAPRLTIDDAQRAMRKIRRWMEPDAPRDRRREFDGLDLHVIAPPMLPWSRPMLLREIQRVALRTTLRRWCKRLGVEQPILVTTVPNAVDALGATNEQRVVYYCVDDFTLWPGVDAEAARSMEDTLIERADVVIATSDSLRRTRTRDGRVPFLLPHGVDLDHFSSASDRGTVPWPGIRRQRPVLGGLGLIDERTDASLVARVAEARPDWDIVMVGPIDQVPESLRRIANLRLIPAVSYADVPRVLAAFDVAILPYAHNALTHAINPLKLREYLASGRPVVATSLPEIAPFSRFVRVADTAEAFVHACAEALDGPRDLRASRHGLLREESWDARAEAFLKYCDSPSRLYAAREEERL